MTDPARPVHDDPDHRALLPEEDHAGSDDARRQTEIILEDSEERTADPEGARRESAQTPDPAD